MATGIVSWSQTAANNATADANVNFAEGQAPSSVNDSARALMASVAKWRDDNAGSLITGGTSTAYTLTTNQVFASLSAMSGQSVRVKFNATNGAAPTLNVDGLGAKAIHSVTGTAVPTGAILVNSNYDLVYDNSNSCWILVSGQKAGYLDAPSGTKILFQQTAAPTGWTKDTTHNDKALRVVSGAASSGGTTAFTSVLAARTITQANLPAATLVTTITDPTHIHAVGSVVAATVNVTLSGGGTPVPNSYTTLVAAATGITASTALGGSGTAMDFAVQYVDTIIAAKD